MARAREPDRALWDFVKEVHRAVEAGNRGEHSPPYASGTFLVSARAGDIELTIKDVSEEDAVLIAAEIRHLGARAVVYDSVVCRHCGRRVPLQHHCTSCRRPLTRS